MNQFVNYAVLTLEPLPYASFKRIDVIVALEQKKQWKLEELYKQDLNLATDYFVELIKATPYERHCFKDFKKRCDVDEFGLVPATLSARELEYYVCEKIEFPENLHALLLPKEIDEKSNALEHTFTFLNLVPDTLSSPVAVTTLNKRTNIELLLYGKMNQAVIDAYCSLGLNKEALDTTFKLFFADFKRFAKQPINYRHASKMEEGRLEIVEMKATSEEELKKDIEFMTGFYAMIESHQAKPIN